METFEIVLPFKNKAGDLVKLEKVFLRSGEVYFCEAVSMQEMKHQTIGSDRRSDTTLFRKRFLVTDDHMSLIPVIRPHPE